MLTIIKYTMRLTMELLRIENEYSQLVYATIFPPFTILQSLSR